MNQMSYEVLSKKIQKRGYKIKSNLEIGIQETLNLLEGINNA